MIVLQMFGLDDKFSLAVVLIEIWYSKYTGAVEKTSFSFWVLISLFSMRLFRRVILERNRFPWINLLYNMELSYLIKLLLL